MADDELIANLARWRRNDLRRRLVIAFAVCALWSALSIWLINWILS